MKLSLPLAAGAGAAVLAAFVSFAAAQTKTTAKAQSATTAAAAAEQDGPITPRKPRAGALESAPAAARAAQTVGEVDWSAVNAAMADSAAEDAATDRQVRAMELSRAVPTEERAKLRRSGVRASSPREYKSVAPKEVAEAQVPVLVPQYGEAQGEMKIASRENSYTAFCDLPDGAYFEMIGTRMRVTGGPEAMRAARTAARRSAGRTMESLGSAPFTISRHEQGIELSFSRFNVAYQVAVYCRDPLNDVRCSQDAYIISLAENLAVLNPEGAGR